MTSTDTIHRRADGSIDIDHYLVEAHAARSAQAHRVVAGALAMPGPATRRSSWVRVAGVAWGLVGLAVIWFAYV